MTTASTIIVYHKGDGTISVSNSIQPGVSMAGHIVERFRVHGSRPLDDLPGTQQLADFEDWKKARESQGFVFVPFPI